MRHELLHHLSKKDATQIMKYICRIARAIHKSPVKKTVEVYRGIHPKHITKAVCAWKSGNIGEIHEWAFESFTEDKAKAAEYAINKYKFCPVLLHLVLEPGDEALYINNVESERLLPPERTYQIVSCENFTFLEKKTGDKHKGKIYTIVKLT